MLMTVCFLAGLALAGIIPPQMAHAVAAAEQSEDCDHHAPKEPSGRAKMDCCAAGFCPMLAQGMLPEAAPQLAITKPVLHPVAVAMQLGLASMPSLRPPRSLI